MADSGLSGQPLDGAAVDGRDITATWLAVNVTGQSPVNQSVDQLLESYLGARYRSLAESLVLTIVYTIIFLTGLVGNVCTCVVITKNTYMHTATNYYLFSLAISDVMTLILGLPPELYTIWEAYPWRLGTPYCLFKTFLTEMTSSASILTIAAFTVERYVAICHPIRSQTMSTLSRAVKIIIGIWLSAALSALPYPLHTRTYYYVINPYTHAPIPESLICNIRPEWLPRMRYVFQVSTFMLFIIPMGLISSLYALIGMTLRRSELSRQTSENSAGSSPHSQPRRAIVKMLACKPSIQSGRQSSTMRRRRKKREIVHTYLVAVVVAFFICWAPFHSQRLMTLYISDNEWTPTLLEIQSLLFYISGVLYFVSSTVNPILYNLMSKKYRQAFKDTLCACFLPSTVRGRRFKRQMGATYERSATYVTYTQAANMRYPGANRQNLTQSSPLIGSRILAKQTSDTSEDEGAYDPELRSSFRSRSLQGSNPDRRTRPAQINKTATRVKSNDVTSANGTLYGEDRKATSKNRTAPDEIRSGQVSIEMTEVSKMT